MPEANLRTKFGSMPEASAEPASTHGSWLTDGVGVEAEKARACLDEAFNQGINFIDTANVYGRGAAESFLGQALRGRPRDSYVLATKVYFPMGPNDRGLSRSQIETQL